MSNMVGLVAKKQEGSSMVQTPSISGARVGFLRPYHLKPYYLNPKPLLRGKSSSLRFLGFLWGDHHPPPPPLPESEQLLQHEKGIKFDIEEESWLDYHLQELCISCLTETAA